MAGTIEDQLNLMNVADVGDSGLDAETLGAEPVRISAPDSARERRSSSADEDLHFLATLVWAARRYGYAAFMKVPCTAARA